MARTIKLSAIVGEWVWFEDDGKTKKTVDPEEIPKGATAFLLTPSNLEFVSHVASGENMPSAIAKSIEHAIADWRGMEDGNGKAVPFDKLLIRRIPVEYLTAIAMYLTDVLMHSSEARRGNARSGRSRRGKSSSGTRMADPGTVSRATT